MINLVLDLVRLKGSTSKLGISLTVDSLQIHFTDSQGTKPFPLKKQVLLTVFTKYKARSWEIKFYNSYILLSSEFRSFYSFGYRSK